ncbi:tetratricopeptide repeat protein [Nisaea sediminum]|uniref:tetratricopeptide repeat protein n=1 Tax=Nisaea sediminum TaxID=2775867 RepID=UPI0018689FE7|nr:tetratricopeptide repeat protein [Nisaea sediminum]
MPDSRDSLLADSRRLMTEGRWNEACARLEQGLAAAPSDILIAFTLATAYRLSGSTERAADLFDRLHNALPDMAEAAVGLAQCRSDLGAPDEARTALRRFAIRNPEASQVYSALGEISLKTGCNDDVVAAFSRSVALAPTAAHHGNLAEALSLRNMFESAERHYKAALKLAPDSPASRRNYAIHLLVQGKVEEGWRAFEARLDPRLPDAPARTLTLPRWDGSDIRERHLLVVSEQGLGDEIRLAALLPELAGKARQLTVECDPRLVSLFERSLPGIRIHAFSRIKRGGRGHYSYGWLPPEDGPDCYIELGSVAFRLARPLTLPNNDHGFLKPDPDISAPLRDRLRDQPGPARWVGLSWASGAQHFGRATNYPPLEAWRDLLSLPDVSFLCLQYDPTAEDIERLSEFSGQNILQLEGLDLRNDIESLAALSGCLDLVLSVGNATAALAGAVGTPTIELLSTPGWVPLIEGQDSFLAANHRCTQSVPGDWSAPMKRARELALLRLAQS